MADEKEPRRFKLPSELDESERAAQSRLGASGRVERAEYAAWRRRVLGEERDDLPLRERLLREESEALRTRARERQARALERLAPADWHARKLAEAARDGKEPESLDDEKAVKWEQHAAELEAEADELAQFAPTGAPLSVEDHVERMSNR